MKKYRYAAAFVLVLGLVAVGPAFAGEASAEPTPAVAVESVGVGAQPAETNAVEQESAKPSTNSEACATEALPSPLQLETRALSTSINCSNCTTCDYAGQKCRCGDFPDTCAGTCQQLGPTFVCLHSCAC